MKERGRVVSHYSPSLLALRELSTNSRGAKPVSCAFESIGAASSRALPNRLPIVNKPDASKEMRSLPARDAIWRSSCPAQPDCYQRWAIMVGPELKLILALAFRASIGRMAYDAVETSRTE